MISRGFAIFFAERAIEFFHRFYTVKNSLKKSTGFPDHLLDII